MVGQLSGVHDLMTRVALVARALTASLRPSEIIDIVVRQGMAGLGAEGGVLMLVAPDGALVPVATAGYTNEAIAAFAPLRVDQDLPLTVAARDGEAIWISSRAEAASRFPALVAASVSASQAWVAIPLVADGSVLGALGVSFLAPREFSDSDRLFIRTLGDQCALSLAAPRPRRLLRTSAAVGSTAPGGRPRPRAVREAHSSIETIVVRQSPHDGPDIGRALREDPRFTVRECDDHESLASLLRDEPLDLVVVAGDLLGASRIEVLDRVRARRPEATLVLLTGDPTLEDLARRLGADAVFGMAVPTGWLRAALATLVDEHERASAFDVEAATDVTPAQVGRRQSPRSTPFDADRLSSTMFDRSLDAVMFTSPDGQVLAANPAACRLLGRSEDEIRSIGRAGLADPSDPRWVAGLKERESSGRFFGELSMLRADGSAFPAEVSSAVFESETGELRTVVVIRDITNHKQSEQELVRLALSDDNDRAAMTQTLLDVAIHRLWAIGTSLQAGLEGSPDLLIDRARTAIRDLDQAIRDLRDTLLADLGPDH